MSIKISIDDLDILTRNTRQIKAMSDLIGFACLNTGADINPESVSEVAHLIYDISTQNLKIIKESSHVNVMTLDNAG